MSNKNKNLIQHVKQDNFILTQRQILLKQGERRKKLIVKEINTKQSIKLLKPLVYI